MTNPRKVNNDGRLRIWLSKDRLWIREALAQRVVVTEKVKPSSVSEEAAKILEQALSGLRP